MPSQSVHAVYYVLNDGEFLSASVRSIYDHVSGITVVTNHDRDRYGNQVDPDGLVDRILAREFDTERKINVVVTVDGSQARVRNRAMDFARRSARTIPIPGEPPGLVAPDLFWHVDADEIYERAGIERLLRFVGRHRAGAYLLEALTYFGTWNYQVPERGHFLALCRPGFRFGYSRTWLPSPWRRMWMKAAHEGLLPYRVAVRPLGAICVPPSVAVCHHGSYVGSRERIVQKLAASSHRDELIGDWVAQTWDRWTPASRNFHPTDPSRFPYAMHIPTAELPAEIRDASWPNGWLEPSRAATVVEA